MDDVDFKAPSNFGRVFVRRKDEGKDWKPVESAYFSKLDLRIYTEELDQLHPEFLDLVGNPFSVGFHIKIPDLLDNTEKEHDGRFRVPLKLGDNPLPDLEHFKEAFELEMRLLRELNMASTEKAEELIRETLMCAYWIFCLPGRPIMEQTLLHKTIAFTIVDDSLEDYGEQLVESQGEDGAIKVKLPYRTLSSMAHMVVSGGFKSTSSGELMGTIDKVFGDSNIPMSKLLDLFGLGKKILKAVIQIRECAEEIGERHGISSEPFIEHFIRAVNALCVEMSAEWKSKDHLTMIPSITGIHADSVFGIVSVEGAALQYGIGVSERIRANPLFKILLSTIGSIYHQINDIISYAREAIVEGEAGRSSNEVYLLHKGLGWPLEKALKKVEDGANESMEQLVSLGDLLLKIYPHEEGGDNKERETLKAYLKTVKEVLTGYIQWYAFIDRYHPGMAYDCYIEM